MMERLKGLGLPEEIVERVARWLGPEFDEGTRQEIGALVDTGNVPELTDRFHRILEFGTGGLRGVMEAGTNRMNRYTVAMATQGLANYLTGIVPEPSVVIAFDSRNNSPFFADVAARVLAANGIKTWVFGTLRPTPELSFAVRHLGTTSGIVITASHNPREYNGYKVFWSDGAQIVAPHDTGIVDEVKKTRTMADTRIMDRLEAEKKGLILTPGPRVDEEFLKNVLTVSYTAGPEIGRAKKDLGIVFTPLNGAGYDMVPRALKQAGFRNVFTVPEQAVPDGNFPSVTYPNPEESESLTLSLKLAREKKAGLVLATDPDCDRLGIAVRPASGGGYRLLNGNQLGSILTHYVLSRTAAAGKLPDNGFIVKSIVTTDLVTAMARHYGVKLFDVLTGFKHIASVIRDNPGMKYLFGFEESYGFMPAEFVRDKDGVSASVLTAEVAAWARTRDMDLCSYLDSLYSEFGCYHERTKYLVYKGIEGMDRIARIMESLRSVPPRSIKGHGLLRVLDYRERTETAFDGKGPGKSTAMKEVLSVSNVLALYFERELKIIIRPSGTEPKIKYYFFFRKDPGPSGLEKTKEELKAYMNGLEEEFTALLTGFAGK